MPGEARTTAFQFTTATIMIGPQSLGFALNPQDHAIGLVKNLQFAQDTSFVELTQGVTNVVVESMINKQSVKMSAEIYEMTARNLAYALGLDADPTAMNQTFGVQIIGVDAVDKTSIRIHIPKAKITNGFAMNFTAESFGNLPFDFEPFMPIPTDPGYSSDFTELFTVFTPNCAP